VNPRRLYRSRRDKSLAGVAGGMAEYLEVDPTVVRILWILAALLSGGLAILLYIVMAFIVPLPPVMAGPATRPAGEHTTEGGWSGERGTAGDDVTEAQWVSPAWGASERDLRPDRPGRGSLAVGIVLVVFGAIALIGPAFPAWAASALGPAFILALGLALVAISARRPTSTR
jgi:phage shock protein C